MNSLMIFWWLLPAGIANMAPVLVKKLSFWDYPIDEQLFGKNKTWRGLLSGILAGALFAELQSFLIPNIYLIAWQWGVLVGAGALLGDLIKSYFKRRVGIASGESWRIADQVDWILGALICTELIASWSIIQWLLVLVIGGGLHVVVNLLGYYLKIKDNKY